jgi:RHS repeat-associated protein
MSEPCCARNIVTWQQQADSDAPTLWAYGYDRADQLTRAVHQTTGGTPSIIKRYAYTHDPPGNRTSEQIDDAGTLATHDSLNRLLTKSPGGPLVFKGTMNEPGRVTVNGVPATVNAANQFQASVPVTAGTTTVTINAVDASGNASEAVYEVDQAGTGKTFTYDANGNMTSDGIRTFEWDARKQLVAVNLGTHRTEFAYDGLRRRVQERDKEQSVQLLSSDVLWCGLEVCEHRITNGSTARLYTDGARIDDAAFYFVMDRVRSIREVTDATGSLASRTQYEPFGRPSAVSGSNPTRLGFTGFTVLDDSDLQFAMYRVYAPALGRWLTEDPAGYRDGPNRSYYVRNNPVRLVDFYGLQGACPETRKPCRAYLHKDVYFGCFLQQVTDPGGSRGPRGLCRPGRPLLATGRRDLRRSHWGVHQLPMPQVRHVL